MKKNKTIYLVLLLFAFIFVQCSGKSVSKQDVNDSLKVGIDEFIESSEKSDSDSISKKEVLTKVLTKEKGEHADDIVVLTPAFIKAVQKYEELGVFSEGLAAIKKKDGKWGYINTKGEEVIPATIEAHWAGRFSEGIAYTDNNDYFCLIDAKGEIVYKHDKNGAAVYDDCCGEGTFSPHMPYYINGKLYLQKMIDYLEEKGDIKWKYDVYDNCGNMTTTHMTSEQYEDLEKNIANQSYIVFNTCKDYVYHWGIKDTKGKILIPARYNFLGNYSNGVFLAGLSENDAEFPTYWGYVDLKGNDTFSKDIKKLYGK